MKIAFLGDIAFHGKYCLESNSALLDYFHDARELLSKCDYVVGNLEAPFVTNGAKSGSKSAYISSLSTNISILKYLNIDAVNLANNHIFDYGSEGYDETVQLLEDNNIEWFGTAGKTLFVSSPEKLAFHGYCSFNTNPLGVRNKRNTNGIEPLDINKLLEQSKKNQSNGYLNILSIHSGVEHVTIPSMDDVNFARALTKHLPFIYHGHHPHVMQGIERIEDSLISYSLGNFCFDDVYDGRSEVPIVTQTDENKSSVVLIVEIVDGIIIDHEIVGIYQSEDKLEVNYIKSETKMLQYSELLCLGTDDYALERVRQVSSVVSSRNSKRDLEWIVNRLSFDTFERFFERILNRKFYKKYFSSKIKKL